MKEKLFKIAGISLLLAGLFLNVNWSKSSGNMNDLTLKNMIAISQAQIEGGSGGSSGTWVCYASLSNCGFWCSGYYRCGNPCVWYDRKDSPNNLGYCHAVGN